MAKRMIILEYLWFTFPLFFFFPNSQNRMEKRVFKERRGENFPRTRRSEDAQKRLAWDGLIGHKFVVQGGLQSGFVGRHVLKPLTAAESQSRVDSGKTGSTWHVATRRPPAPLRAGSKGESVTRSSYGYATNPAGEDEGPLGSRRACRGQPAAARRHGRLAVEMW